MLGQVKASGIVGPEFCRRRRCWRAGGGAGGGGAGEGAGPGELFFFISRG